jgi:hypothetical protein
MEALVSEDTEKVGRKIWAYFAKYAENLGKKEIWCEENKLKNSDKKSGSGGNDDKKFGTDNIKVLVYPKPTAVFKSLLPLRTARLRPFFY